jgi:RNA-binding protein
MTGKERAVLRAEAHHLRPTVHVGQHGITDSVCTSLDDALRTRELVKVQFGKGISTDAKAGANQLATTARAEVIQVIGRTATLYRPNPELERRPGDAPPWKE